MLPTLSQVCSLHSPFDHDVREYAAGKCRHLEVWLTKLEQFVEANSVAAAKELLASEGVTPVAASFHGGLLDSQGDARREAWALLEKRLELCREMEIEIIIVACDVAGPLEQTLLDRVQASLGQLAETAGRAGIKIALEFQANAVVGNNLRTAVALIEPHGSPHLGICLDLYHFEVGPSKFHDLAHLNAENLFHVQVCDLADVPRELSSDADRILPGDGDIAWEPVLQRLRDIDYQGAVSVELMNPQMWQVPPREFGEIALTAVRKQLGIAD